MKVSRLQNLNIIIVRFTNCKLNSNLLYSINWGWVIALFFPSQPAKEWMWGCACITTALERGSLPSKIKHAFHIYHLRCKCKLFIWSVSLLISVPDNALEKPQGCSEVCWLVTVPNQRNLRMVCQSFLAFPTTTQFLHWTLWTVAGEEPVQVE